MSEILVKAIDAKHADPDKDARGCYKVGMPVVVMPDGHIWGLAEGPPTFVVIKLPGVSVEAVQKYIESYDDAEGNPVRRRKWQIRLDSLPVATKTLLSNKGEIVVKVGKYDGKADDTWAQVSQCFNNFATKLNESAALEEPIVIEKPPVVIDKPVVTEEPEVTIKG